jgi:hypothetical protein
MGEGKEIEVDELTFVFDICFGHLVFFHDKSRQFGAFGVDYGFRTQIWGR